jgi:hypothetical protein
MTDPQASPPVGDDLVERDRLAVETWIAGGCSSWGVPVQSIQRIITPPSTPKVKEASVGEVDKDADYLRFIASDIATHEDDARRLCRIAAALDSPQPATRGVEAALHKLIDAARMYEASCRLGGRDQEFAGLKLDEAKAAAIATIAPQLDVREALDLLEEAQLLFAHGVGAMTDNGDKANQERNIREAGELNLRISEFLTNARSTLSNVLGSPE